MFETTAPVSDHRRTRNGPSNTPLNGMKKDLNTVKIKKKGKKENQPGGGGGGKNPLFFPRVNGGLRARGAPRRIRLIESP